MRRTNSASNHIAASLNANAPAAPVNAAAGGTGNSTYAVGDILVANSTSSLGRLTAGSPGQVVGISSTGGVMYVTNGATVTNNVISQNVAATEDLGVTNAAGYIRLTNNTNASLNVTGVQVSPNFANGSVVTLVNISASPSDVIQLTNLDNTSVATDQFDLPGGQPILLTQKARLPSFTTVLFQNGSLFLRINKVFAINHFFAIINHQSSIPFSQQHETP